MIVLRQQCQGYPVGPSFIAHARADVCGGGMHGITEELGTGLFEMSTHDSGYTSRLANHSRINALSQKRASFSCRVSQRVDVCIWGITRQREGGSRVVGTGQIF